jgi:hypothetical protein
MCCFLFVGSQFRRYPRAVALLFCLGLLLPGLPGTTRLHAQQAPRLKAPDFDGAVGPTLGSDKPVRLKDLRGKIVIVEFWTLC